MDLKRTAEAQLFHTLRSNFMTLPKNEEPFSFDDVADLDKELYNNVKSFEQEILDNLLLLEEKNRLDYLLRSKANLEMVLSGIQNSMEYYEDYDPIIIVEEVLGSEKLLKHEVPKDVWTSAFHYRINACNNIIQFLYSQIAIESALNYKEEKMPEFEYKGEIQKVAWLHELGILKYVLELCREGETYNWSRAGNIISSFTGVHAKNILIRSLRAIFHPNHPDDANHPLKTRDNKLFVQEMKRKFKLNIKDQEE